MTGSPARSTLPSVQSAFVALREACAGEEFVGDCLVQQTRIIKEGYVEPEVADDADGELDGDWGVALTSVDGILPEGWVEPALDSMTPSEYLTKLLSEL